MAKLRLLNPRKRRRKNPVSVLSRKQPGFFKKARRKSRRRNPIGARKRRRNPISVKKMLNQDYTKLLIGAGGGAAVALGLDMLLTKITKDKPITDPVVRYALLAAGAIGSGIVTSQVAGKSNGAAVGIGAAAVVAAQAIAEYKLRSAAPAVAGIGKYVNGVGKYVNGMGYMNPGRLAGLGVYTDAGGLPAVDPMRDIGVSDFTPADLNPTGDPCTLW